MLGVWEHRTWSLGAPALLPSVLLAICGPSAFVLGLLTLRELPRGYNLLV